MLDGKRLVMTGVLTKDSIAFAAARRAQELGAEIVLTSFGRQRRMTERAAKGLDPAPDILELDVNSESDLLALREELSGRWGNVDGVLHAIAFAPPDALGGNFLNTPPDSAAQAFLTSAYSLKSLSETLLPLMEGDHAGPAGGTRGGGIVGLDFDASVAWPVYDWMGVAKAALEAVSRYLARDLGPRGVRVNLVSAGPIETLAAGGIPGFDQLAGTWRDQAPLGWDAADPGPVADAICFLLSDLARGISGEIVHVDGGFHAMGAPPATPADPAETAGAQ
jgi:enoyl-[acyl-carrier protein] reductase I